MKQAYKIYLTKCDDGYLVSIPDFNCDTQGTTIADAIYMARDAIGLMGLDYLLDGKDLPLPGSVEYVKNEKEFETYVDIDFDLYRRQHDQRKIKKTLSIPCWLNERAEELNINFSRVLEEALLNKIK
ncbi:MAG: type II toxin-antitoxin system HicB family antitoxin [Bacillus sp. (in: firmicutes)]